MFDLNHDQALTFEEYIFATSAKDFDNAQEKLGWLFDHVYDKVRWRKDYLNKNILEMVCLHTPQNYIYVAHIQFRIVMVE